MVTVRTASQNCRAFLRNADPKSVGVWHRRPTVRDHRTAGRFNGNMKIGFAQINPIVGDLRGNCELIARAYERLAAAGGELVSPPQRAVTGYPPQDLVLKSRFVPENLELLNKLHGRIGEAALLVGFVDRNEGRGKPFRNAAALLERGKPIRKTYKSLLPTYDVFDEERYFQPAERVEPVIVH